MLEDSKSSFGFSNEDFLFLNVMSLLQKWYNCWSIYTLELKECKLQLGSPFFTYINKLRQK
ncbi:MAG: hypothetical protein E7593_05205 [Ruminococcaceae bacterium]|nr:hypothetical protein [Oscillospiraceae bacterium]